MLKFCPHINSGTASQRRSVDLSQPGTGWSTWGNKSSVQSWWAPDRPESATVNFLSHRSWSGQGRVVTTRRRTARTCKEAQWHDQRRRRVLRGQFMILILIINNGERVEWMRPSCLSPCLVPGSWQLHSGRCKETTVECDFVIPFYSILLEVMHYLHWWYDWRGRHRSTLVMHIPWYFLGGQRQQVLHNLKTYEKVLNNVLRPIFICLFIDDVCVSVLTKFFIFFIPKDSVTNQ